MGVIGLDAVKAIASHINLGKRIIDYLKRDFRPDLVLLVDYGGFNLRLAKVLHENHIPVYYYISPQVWASRKGRLDTIKKYITKMMVILPFEEELHKKNGVNAEYVGHPLISQSPSPCNKRDFILNNHLDPNKKIIGIFPAAENLKLTTFCQFF